VSSPRQKLREDRKSVGVLYMGEPCEDELSV
jgi:hypothetical protein